MLSQATLRQGLCKLATVTLMEGALTRELSCLVCREHSVDIPQLLCMRASSFIL